MNQVLPNNYQMGQQSNPYQPNPQSYSTPQQATNQPFTNSIMNSIVWVETEEEAKTWMVGPNNRVFVFVGDNQVLYVKEKNSDGRPLKTEIYDLTKRQVIEGGDTVDLKDYVRKEDVSKMISDAVAAAMAERDNQSQRRYYNRNQNGRNYRNGGNE